MNQTYFKIVSNSDYESTYSNIRMTSTLTLMNFHRLHKPPARIDSYGLSSNHIVLTLIRVSDSLQVYSIHRADSLDEVSSYDYLDSQEIFIESSTRFLKNFLKEPLFEIASHLIDKWKMNTLELVNLLSECLYMVNRLEAIKWLVERYDLQLHMDSLMMRTATTSILDVIIYGIGLGTFDSYPKLAYYAICRNQFPTIRYLVENGFDLGNHGVILRACLDARNVKILRYFCEKGYEVYTIFSDIDQMYAYCRYKHLIKISILKILIEYGFDLEANSHLILKNFSFYGKPKHITFLLDQGLNPTAPDIMFALLTGKDNSNDLPLIMRLINSGADLYSNLNLNLYMSTRCESFSHVLEIATKGSCKNPEVIRYFLQLGPDDHCIEESFLACIKNEKLSLLKVLIDHVDVPNLKPKIDDRIPHNIPSSLVPILEILLEFGWKTGLNASDDIPKRAIWSNNPDLIRLLAKNGLNLEGDDYSLLKSAHRYRFKLIIKEIMDICELTNEDFERIVGIDEKKF